MAKETKEERLSEKLKGYVDNAKERISGAKEECTDLIEGFFALADNFIDNYPGKETVQGNVRKVVNKVASTFNLPTIEEAKRLSSLIDQLNYKIEAMSKK